MGKSRKTLLGAVILVIAALIVGAVYIELLNNSQNRISAYQVVTSVGAGEPFTSGNVQQVQIQSQDNSLLENSPTGKIATHNLAVGDLLRADDVGSAALFVQVLLTLQQTPVVGAGSLIDVYTVVGDNVVLLGKHLSVVSGGTSATVNIPVSNEGYWLSLVANQTKLYAAVVPDALGNPSSLINSNQAISKLSGLSAAELQTGTSPTPSPGSTASATPTAGSSPTPTPSST